MERRNLLSDRDNQKQIEKLSPDASPSNRLLDLRKSHSIGFGQSPHRWGDQQVCTTEDCSSECKGGISSPKRLGQREIPALSREGEVAQ
jgi:hypothetical protein